MLKKKINLDALDALVQIFIATINVIGIITRAYKLCSCISLICIILQFILLAYTKKESSKSHRNAIDDITNIMMFIYPVMLALAAVFNVMTILVYS